MKPTETITGMFAFSKAGHDKGSIYIIIEETQEYVYLADGWIKTLANPKKKNRRHIQVIKKDTDKELADRLLQTDDSVTNEEIRRAIKLYQQEQSQEVKNV